MKASEREFSYICKATREWNSIFSFPVLFLLATKLLTAACSLFAFIQGLFLPSILFSAVHWFLLAIFCLDCIMMTIVFTAADMPVREVGLEEY